MSLPFFLRQNDQDLRGQIEKPHPDPGKAGEKTQVPSPYTDIATGKQQKAYGKQRTGPAQSKSF